MGASGGPKIVTSGLKFLLDVASRKSISAIGMEGWNGSPQAFKNILNPTQNIDVNNGARLGNVTPYTIFAIDYPEGSYGGSAAGRDGIQQGFNATSGTRVRDYSRALNYAVWNEGTESWLGSSYFNGSYDSGHCYDSWGGAAEPAAQVSQFVTDYNNIKTSFPQAIHIVAGSHRDSTHGTSKCNVLKDLGAPSNVSSLLDSAPEWIVVGRPGLGAGNAYAWAFENYSTDPTRVAHVNFGLPIFGQGRNNYIEFDGTDDYLQVAMTNGSADHSCEVWFWLDVTSNQNILFNTNGQGLYPRIMYYNGNITAQYSNGSTRMLTGPSLTTGRWHHALFSYDSSIGGKFYVNGTLAATNTTTGALSGNGTSSYNMRIGYDSNLSTYLNGRITNVQIYDTAINSRKTVRNFRAKRKRYR